MGLWHFLNSTGDMGNNKRQRHATLTFLKIDMRHQDPPSRASTGGMKRLAQACHCMHVYLSLLLYNLGIEMKEEVILCLLFVAKIDIISSYLLPC